MIQIPEIEKKKKNDRKEYNNYVLVQLLSFSPFILIGLLWLFGTYGDMVIGWLPEDIRNFVIHYLMILDSKWK